MGRKYICWLKLQQGFSITIWAPVLQRRQWEHSHCRKLITCIFYVISLFTSWYRRIRWLLMRSLKKFCYVIKEFQCKVSDQLAVEPDARESTSAETLPVSASSTLGQRLFQIRRWKKKIRENMFNELMHASESNKTELRAWKITLSENMEREDRRVCREQEHAT
ncbi:unnamed protein product [Caretta caretta]